MEKIAPINKLMNKKEFVLQIIKALELFQRNLIYKRAFSSQLDKYVVIHMRLSDIGDFL